MAMSRRPPDCSPIRGDIPRLLTEVYVKSLRERVGPVSTTCARFLYVITRALSTARRGLTALEVGTGLGYSALWIGFGMLDSGFPGKLYTIEVKEERAREARENVAIAGLSRLRRGPVREDAPAPIEPKCQARYGLLRYGWVRISGISPLDKPQDANRLRPHGSRCSRPIPARGSRLPRGNNPPWPLDDRRPPCRPTRPQLLHKNRGEAP